MIMENEPIRVLHIVPNMQAGGLETLIMNIYRNIDRTKVQFDFLVHYTGNYFYDDEIRSLGGRIYKLSVRDDNNFIKYLKDLDAFFKKHPEYKIVHGHMESLGQFYFKAAKKDGVDSSVAAWLMQQAGYDCTGITMRLTRNETLGQSGFHTCCSEKDIEDAAEVAYAMDIPYEVLDFTADFREQIIEKFVRVYEAGGMAHAAGRL